MRPAIKAMEDEIENLRGSFFVFDIKNFSNSQFRACFSVVVFCVCTMLNIVKLSSKLLIRLKADH